MLGLLRAALVIVGLTSSPAFAWEFSISPICTVTDRGSDTGLKLTFDGELYALHLSHLEGWQNAEVFEIRRYETYMINRGKEFPKDPELARQIVLGEREYLEARVG